MLWIEEKYINILAPRLSLFKKVKPNTYNFRCPICGDSKKNLYKTRGGFYCPPGSQSYNMGCFNCGASMKFTTFLKQTDPNLYDEFQMEIFKERNGMSDAAPKEDAPKSKPKRKKLDMTALTRVSDLPESHPAMQYIMYRKIPKKQWRRLYYAPKYYQWISEFEGKKYDPRQEHPRLIIPFFDTAGNVTRIAARAFGAEEPRYRYTVVDSTSTKLYGMDTIDTSKEVFVVEGPLDSLFFDNAIAVGMASYEDKELNSIPDKLFIPDNQPRNESVCKSFEKVVKRGEKVCIWQEETEKDINDMVVEGKRSIESIIKLIHQSTFSGLEASMKFNEWIKY